LASRLAANSATADAMRYAQAAAALHVSTPVVGRLAINPSQVRELMAEA